MSTTDTIISAARYDLQDFAGQNFDDTQLLEYLNRALRILDDVLIQNNSDYTTAYTVLQLEKYDTKVSLPSDCDSVKEVWLDQSNRLQKVQLDNLNRRRAMNLLISTYDEDTDWTGAGGSRYYTTWYKEAIMVEESIASAGYEALTLNSGNYATLSAGEYDVDTVNSRLYVRLTGDVAPGSTNPVRAHSIDSAQPEFFALNDSQLLFDTTADIAYLLHIFYNERADALTDGATIPYSGDFDEYLREAVVMLAGKAKENRLVRPDEMVRRLFEKHVRRRVVSREYANRHYRLDF